MNGDEQEIDIAKEGETKLQGAKAKVQEDLVKPHE